MIGKLAIGRDVDTAQPKGLLKLGPQGLGLGAVGGIEEGDDAWHGSGAQGQKAQGHKAQGLRAQGLRAQGLKAQGLKAQGLRAKGLKD